MPQKKIHPEKKMQVLNLHKLYAFPGYLVKINCNIVLIIVGHLFTLYKLKTTSVSQLITGEYHFYYCYYKERLQGQKQPCWQDSSMKALSSVIMQAKPPNNNKMAQ